jgi:hypothetical protein
LGNLTQQGVGNRQAPLVNNRVSRLGSIAHGRTNNRHVSYVDDRVSASAACWDAPTSYTTPAGALMYARIQAEKAAAAEGLQVMVVLQDREIKAVGKIFLLLLYYYSTVYYCIS